VVTDKTPDTVASESRKTIRQRGKTEDAKSFDIGGNIISTRAEMSDNRDLLDGSQTSELSLESGDYTVTAPQQNTIRSNIKAQHRAIHARAKEIADLVKAEVTATAMITVLDAEINSGWPA